MNQTPKTNPGTAGAAQLAQRIGLPDAPLRVGCFVAFTEGPCCTRTRFTGALEGVTVHSWLVTDPGHVAVRSLYAFKDTVSDDAARRVFENSQFGWGRDVEIWHHKRYRDRPNLVPEEAIVHDFRRWFSQFYAGASAIGAPVP